MKPDNWYKLYGGSWSGLISPNAMAHPAKFSRKLIFRIFEHAIEEGWIKPGETCIDIFGGVALGGLPAMLNGLHWIGVELEARFCALAQENIDLWNSRYAKQMPNWGTAIIVQGDSRRLGEVLERARICVSSPPFIGSIREGKSGIDVEKLDKAGPNSQARIMGGYGNGPGQLAQMPEGDLALAISSPPFLAQSGGTNVTAQSGPLANALLLKRHSAGNQAAEGYGVSDGQLAALPEGDHAEACGRPVCAISSPPFPDGGMGDKRFGGGLKDKSIIEVSKVGGGGLTDYGNEQGQLGQMPTGSHAEALEAERVQACISSPPFEGIVPVQDKTFWINDGRKVPPQGQEGYGDTAGQLGQQQGSTFWAASRQILEQVYQVLAPGGHATWVLKMFVRSGRLVDFPGQWEQLCQSVGFRTVCKHRAWLNKNADIMQTTFDGDEVSMEKWYKSFFRILCEKKGAPRIDWELILCMEKPQ